MFQQQFRKLKVIVWMYKKHLENTKEGMPVVGLWTSWPPMRARTRLPISARAAALHVPTNHQLTADLEIGAFNACALYHYEI